MNPRTGGLLLTEITQDRFAEQVLGVRGPVLVAFVATWSRPCRILEEVLKEVSFACAESARVFIINADDSLELSLLYGIDTLPTLLFFVDGKVQTEIVGTATTNAILVRLHTILQQSGTAAAKAETALGE